MDDDRGPDNRVEKLRIKRTFSLSPETIALLRRHAHAFGSEDEMIDKIVDRYHRFGGAAREYNDRVQAHRRREQEEEAAQANKHLTLLKDS